MWLSLKTLNESSVRPSEYCFERAAIYQLSLHISQYEYACPSDKRFFVDVQSAIFVIYIFLQIVSCNIAIHTHAHIHTHTYIYVSVFLLKWILICILRCVLCYCATNWQTTVSQQWLYFWLKKNFQLRKYRMSGILGRKVAMVTDLPRVFFPQERNRIEKKTRY